MSVEGDRCNQRNGLRDDGNNPENGGLDENGSSAGGKKW